MLVNICWKRNSHADIEGLVFSNMQSIWEANLNKLLLVFMCLFAWSGQAMADSFADAERAYHEGDYTKAAKLYRSLAEQGDAIAQTRLAGMYERGKGVLQDYKEVVKWTRLAAEQGNGFAQGVLGAMYKDGEGVPQDYVLAHMWTNVAAANEDGSGRNVDIEQRDEIANKMTPKQIAEAQELARKCTASKFKGC
jgi:TPR repeat protein